MGSKQSITGATEWVFFQITFFGTKNHRKNDIFELSMVFLIFKYIGLTPGIPKGCFQHPQDVV